MSDHEPKGPKIFPNVRPRCARIEGVDDTEPAESPSDLSTALRGALDALSEQARPVRTPLLFVETRHIADMRLTPVPLGGAPSCAGCGAETDTHLLLGTVLPDGTRLGSSRGICRSCRITLANVLLDGETH